MFQNSCKRSKIEFESASQTPFFEVAHFDAPTMSPSKRNNKGYTIKDVNNKRTWLETTKEDRKRIISFLSNRLLEGNGPPKLIHGALSECASHFGWMFRLYHELGKRREWAIHTRKSSLQHLRGKQEGVISIHPMNCVRHWLIFQSTNAETTTQW